MHISPIKGQTRPAQSQKLTPETVQFTERMNQAAKDMEWANTYYNSYRQTQEVPYLRLSAVFCGKAIVMLAETQQLLARTTAFFNRADQKRLQACQFYDKLQKKSFLLAPEHRLQDSGSICE